MKEAEAKDICKKEMRRKERLARGRMRKGIKGTGEGKVRRSE